MHVLTMSRQLIIRLYYHRIVQKHLQLYPMYLTIRIIAILKIYSARVRFVSREEHANICMCDS
jgi:hypothetical protein